MRTGNYHLWLWSKVAPMQGYQVRRICPCSVPERSRCNIPSVLRSASGRYWFCDICPQKPSWIQSVFIYSRNISSIIYMHQHKGLMTGPCGEPSLSLVTSCVVSCHCPHIGWSRRFIWSTCQLAIICWSAHSFADFWLWGPWSWYSHSYRVYSQAYGVT